MSVLEDTFNVLPLSAIEQLKRDLGETPETLDKLSVIEEYENTSLEDYNEVMDLTQHNKEMDELAKKMMKDYEEVFEAAVNSDSRNAAELFNAATTMADISLKAKMSKIDARMRAIQLTINRNKLQPPKEEGIQTDGIVMDRNQLLKMMMEPKIDAK